MVIEYLCKNCKKVFKVKDYMSLEMTYAMDGSSENIMVPKGRKCDSCGKEICTNNKSVRA